MGKKIWGGEWEEQRMGRGQDLEIGRAVTGRRDIVIKCLLGGETWKLILKVNMLCSICSDVRITFGSLQHDTGCQPSLISYNFIRITSRYSPLLRTLNTHPTPFSGTYHGQYVTGRHESLTSLSCMYIFLNG